MVEILRVPRSSDKLPISYTKLACDTSSRDRHGFDRECARRTALRRLSAAGCQRHGGSGVPAKAHWFDKRADPEFTATRPSNIPKAGSGDFTGDAIAQRFPLYE